MAILKRYYGADGSMDSFPELRIHIQAILLGLLACWPHTWIVMCLLLCILGW